MPAGVLLIDAAALAAVVAADLGVSFALPEPVAVGDLSMDSSCADFVLPVLLLPLELAALAPLLSPVLTIFCSTPLPLSGG